MVSKQMNEAKYPHFLQTKHLATWVSELKVVLLLPYLVDLFKTNIATLDTCVYVVKSEFTVATLKLETRYEVEM
jgi:hypothetical protein